MFVDPRLILSMNNIGCRLIGYITSEAAFQTWVISFISLNKINFPAIMR